MQFRHRCMPFVASSCSETRCLQCIRPSCLAALADYTGLRPSTIGALRGRYLCIYLLTRDGKAHLCQTFSEVAQQPMLVFELM